MERSLRTLFLSLLIAIGSTGHGQGIWVWEDGNSDLWPVPGPLGQFGPAFTPAKRYAGAAWTDSTGRFWLYGADDFNDLWCFDPTIEQWALMNGSGNLAEAPVYGAMGVPGPNVTPGAAQYGHPAWATADGSLWMYGNNTSSDMWRYDIALGQWAWMSGYQGANPAVYGVQGVPAPANSPGNVPETDCHWVDSNGDLWLFNDLSGVLWKYDTGIDQWVWISGTPGGAQSLGGLGVYAANNQPGANSNCPMMGTLWCMWQDADDGLWMIYNMDQGANVAAQLWRYDIGLGQWACMRTDQAPYGEYAQPHGAQCVEDATHAPVARGELRMRWVDDCDRLWIHGGVPMCSPSSYFADLWRYDPITNDWTWVRDAFNATANIGVQDVMAPTNRPDPNAGAFVWTSAQGFWMFGGNSNSNDAGNVFHYIPDTVVADFSFEVDDVQCQHVTFTDLSTTGCNGIKERVWDFGDPGSGVANTSSLIDPVHDYSASGTFTVTLVVKNCTWDADTVQYQVTIACTTTVTLAPDTICAGECAALQAVVLGGTPPYTFTWSNGITDTTAGPLQVCPSVTTTYSVIVTDALGASDTASAEITVIPPPVVDLGADTIACAPPIALNAGNAGATYVWSSGSTAQSINANSSGLYWVNVDNGACVASDSIHVQFEGPLVDLGPDTVTCHPEMLLDAGAGDVTYLWQNGSTAQTFQAPGIGTYWVAVTDANGCTVTDTITIALDDPDVDLGPDQAYCDSVVLLLDAGPAWETFLWQDGSFLQTLQVEEGGAYSVTATVGECVAHDTVQITIHDPQAIGLVSDTSGCPPLTVQFTDASIAPGTSIVSWLWSFGDGTTSNAQNTSHPYDQPGIYQVSLLITTANGCQDTTVLLPSILVHPIPGVGFQYAPPTAMVDNATIHFTDNSIGAVAWSWDFGDGDSSAVQDPEHTYLAAGEYTVTLTVTNEFGCKAVISYTLVITGTSAIYIPNAVTPNGDGINDLFIVQGTGLREVELLIFDRWGELIFDAEGMGRGWDGTYRGREVKDGVYEYKVRYRIEGTTGVHQAIGHVTVLR